MKKLMCVLAFAGLSSVAMAQQSTEIPTEKYSVATNSFGSNWFLSAGGDYTAFYSDEEGGLGLSKNPFKNFRRSWGADVAVGKWFTPGLGLRLKGQGVWGKQITGNPSNEIKQWNLSLQAMFNLNNLFCGYSEDRIWNISLYGGAGMVRNCSYDEYSTLYSVGFLNTWNLTKRVHLNLDIYAQVAEKEMDGVVKNTGRGNFLQSRDRQLGVSVGVGVNLGKVGWSKTPDVDAIMALNKSQMDALNASLADQQSENARLKALLDKRPQTTETKTIKELVSTTASVFFNLNSSRIASKKDLVNVKEIADYAKANNKKIVVTGYADSKTGSASYNSKLSESRAKTVADQLVQMGVSRDMIVVEGKGGVADLNPYSYNRRVTVQVR